MSRAKIIGIVNQKGGCGKTTKSVSLSSCLSDRGFKVLLIDADPQGSASDWAAAGAKYSSSIQKRPVVVQIARPGLAEDIDIHKESFDYIIIDSPGSISRNDGMGRGAVHASDLIVPAIIKSSDLVIIPIKPSPYDIWGADSVVRMIQERQILKDGKPLARILLTMVKANTTLESEIKDALSEYPIPLMHHQIGEREIYKQTSLYGRSVLNGNNPDAKEELNNITDEILELLENVNE